MNVKKGKKIVFILSVVLTEITIYLLIFFGVSLTAEKIFNEFNIFRNALLSIIIGLFGMWLRYIDGFYLQKYKEYLKQEWNKG